MQPTYKELAETVKTIDEFAEKPAEEQAAFFNQLGTTLLLHAPPTVVRTWVGVAPVSWPVAGFSR